MKFSGRERILAQKIIEALIYVVIFFAILLAMLYAEYAVLKPLLITETTNWLGAILGYAAMIGLIPPTGYLADKTTNWMNPIRCKNADSSMEKIRLCSELSDKLRAQDK